MYVSMYLCSICSVELDFRLYWILLSLGCDSCVPILFSFLLGLSLMGCNNLGIRVTTRAMTISPLACSM